MYRLWQINKFDFEQKKKQIIVNAYMDTEFWSFPISLQFGVDLVMGDDVKKFIVRFLCFGVRFTFIPARDDFPEK